MAKGFTLGLSLLFSIWIGIGNTAGQEAIAEGAPAAMAANAPAAPPAAVVPVATPSGGGNFFAVVRGSGIMGMLLWMALLAALFAGVWFIVYCSIFVRIAKIIPRQLVADVTDAMAHGDLLKAIAACEREPGPLSNILKAGFGHVEEGFETIQDAVSVAAEMESEALMQQIAYLSVVGNLAPMLGLLGTVQGMIYAFASLATGGAAQTGVLAMNISQALYTTAAGLSIAVPAVTAFFIFRNRASKITLKMEAMTLDLIKDLRNVEVIED